jgi:CubicO group peptidase (beta-lactamase class C family)
MRYLLCRLLLSIASVSVIAALPAAASERVQDPRIQQFENGLLPRVALKKNLGRTSSITQRMQDLGMPGVSVAVIDAGKVVLTRAYGLSDTVEKTPVTTETLFQAGSISKPVAALGALRLVKEGKLSLDEDVNAKLRTWRVPENELTTTEKVTLRRLVSHTAGLTVHGFPGYAAGVEIPTVVQVLNGEPPANTAPVRVRRDIAPVVCAFPVNYISILRWPRPGCGRQHPTWLSTSSTCRRPSAATLAHCSTRLLRMRS